MLVTPGERSEPGVSELSDIIGLEEAAQIRYTIGSHIVFYAHKYLYNNKLWNNLSIYKKIFFIKIYILILQQSP